MSIALQTMISALKGARNAQSAAEVVVEFGEALDSVLKLLIIKATGATKILSWFAGDSEDFADQYLFRIEEKYREWLAGRAGTQDKIAPPGALILEGSDEEMEAYLFPMQLSQGHENYLMLIVPSPFCANPQDEWPQYQTIRDLFYLAARSIVQQQAPEKIALKPTKTKQGKFRRERIMTRSEKMYSIFSKLDRVVNLDLPIMVTGETGTGKELIARAIHESSPRAKKRFFAQNCAAISKGLLESELFGHVKGSFTSADRDKKGLFEAASGSTLFLDEIGEMNLEAQKKLLRVLQAGVVTPVGSTEERKVDVRIVCATNRNLKTEVEQKRFRQDLYFRLRVFQFSLPPLRDRKEDIPLLIDHFLDKRARKTSRQKIAFDYNDSRVLAAFLNHNWPGNIRELENTVTRLSHFAENTITYDTITNDEQFRDDLQERMATLKPVRPLETCVEECEREEIMNALLTTKGNRSRAADMLRVNRRSLLRRIQKYNLQEFAKD